MAKKTVTKKKKQTIDFDKSLILFQYFLSYFKSNNFKELKKYFENEELEGFTEENRTKFYEKIILENIFDDNKITIDKIREYDENIVKHTNRINGIRESKIHWKYFQYLTLLFTEMYLDKYFSNSEKLLSDLNEFKTKYLEDLNYSSDIIGDYTKEDLTKLAYWNATGSGKTLILHINILQYKHYMEKTNKYKVDRFLILTPNEGLSKQHLSEFQASSIPASIFEEGLSLFKNSLGGVEIIDINKIKIEKSSSSKDTFDLSSFGENNLLLVDEGHRGTSGKQWLKIRRTLCLNGFSFEYSATFGQAIKEEDKDLVQEYSKSIIFDYSYKYFYRDGYGKDYNILNMSEVKNETHKKIYLISSVLAFYEQLEIFKSSETYEKNYNIEKPLMLFVGGSVNKTASKKDTSDVLDIILFIEYFSKNSGEVTNFIEDILKSQTGLNNKNGQDIYLNRFRYLREKGFSYGEIYSKIMSEVFNAYSGALLRLEDIKKADGEIGLKLGDSNYFGVINIGDTGTFKKLCLEHGLNFGENQFDETEFDKINKKNSTINILIGSKKFTEGWSSWRVSSMGLMNIGKNQGSQIIQLFGRGVRLKGYKNLLKRSKALQKIDLLRTPYVSTLETLNIFGVEANYMEEFRKYLEDEGLPTEVELESITIPVEKNKNYVGKLKTIKIKDNLNFKSNGPSLILSQFVDSEDVIKRFRKSLQKIPVKLNRYSTIQTIQSVSGIGNKGILNEENIPEVFLEFIDYDKIFFEIQEYKNERHYYNINISKNSLKEILKDSSWYYLYIEENELKFSLKKISQIQEIAIILLKKYLDRFFKFMRSDWERDKIEYSNLSSDDNNLINEYEVQYNPDSPGIKSYLEKIVSEMENKSIKDFDNFSLEESGFEIFGLNSHLYNPLIFVGKEREDEIKVTPVHLNEGEHLFLNTLKNYYHKNIDFFRDKEIYLLRNQVRNLGLFDEGNFYPDFILWINFRNKQYINFIDPKGLTNEGLENSFKVRMAETIKSEYQSVLGDPDIELNSFIISITDYQNLVGLFPAYGQQDYYQKNVFFITNTMSDKDREMSIQMIFEKIILG